MDPTQTPLNALFNYQLGQAAIDALVSTFGTAVSGPLGAITVSLFLISLLWVWVKNKFDTWSFWELFLRLFITAAGLSVWHSIFFFVDDSLGYVATLFGHVDPNTQIADILLTPFANITSVTFSLLQIGSCAPLFQLIGLILFFIAWAMYNLNVVGAFFTTMLLYMIGPIFLACFVFEPLHDVWMRWVRFYLTVKVWMLVMNAFIYMVDTFMAANMSTDWGQVNAGLFADCYLFFLIVGFGASFPIARGLIGGAGTVLGSGSFVPGVAAAAAGTALAVGGLAVGGTIGGPVGATAGAAAGGGLGKAGSSALAPRREG
jgi:type IV secretory pathway VirB6-like protein